MNDKYKLEICTEWAKKVSCCIAGCNFINYAST